MTEKRWDTKELHEYTIDDSVECWAERECSVVSDVLLEKFKSELATLRAKAEAWDRIKVLAEVEHSNAYLGGYVRGAIHQFRKKLEHPNA